MPDPNSFQIPCQSARRSFNSAVSSSPRPGGWILLWAAVIALAACAPVAHRGESPRKNPPSLEATEKELFEAMNRARKREGLVALEWDRELARIAVRHSTDMLQRDYFSHETPKGQGPFDRVVQSHSRDIVWVAENLWRGTGYPADEVAERAVSSWLQSPGHRRNLLAERATLTAVGVAWKGKETRVTALYADPR